ncbi:uncharacterized protein STEHIDRAFT_161075 [Stereum hirsutum FP-91666 SS1]|uniref:uncharacterized protein n=1 Tax=Stereum hirsutum (strain FP-91666) TaxID=721885 RepID=UPI000444A539|nr:uncharacterized protein STEHIDRAFT_161075 [Stereum hirsutum FP-91666 SS1]EIM82538.1 hypothetical protein STEHIDRAFT_161075 [Stereum hirsutum FP-91666 SS1]
MISTPSSNELQDRSPWQSVDLVVVKGLSTPSEGSQQTLTRRVRLWSLLFVKGGVSDTKFIGAYEDYIDQDWRRPAFSSSVPNTTSTPGHKSFKTGPLVERRPCRGPGAQYLFGGKPTDARVFYFRAVRCSKLKTIDALMFNTRARRLQSSTTSTGGSLWGALGCISASAGSLALGNIDLTELKHDIDIAHDRAQARHQHRPRPSPSTTSTSPTTGLKHDFDIAHDRAQARHRHRAPTSFKTGPLG